MAPIAYRLPGFICLTLSWVALTCYPSASSQEPFQYAAETHNIFYSRLSWNWDSHGRVTIEKVLGILLLRSWLKGEAKVSNAIAVGRWPNVDFELFPIDHDWA